MAPFCLYLVTLCLLTSYPTTRKIVFSTLDRDLASDSGLTKLLTGKAFRDALYQALYEASSNPNPNHDPNRKPNPNPKPKPKPKPKPNTKPNPKLTR